jgi:hypothetical protein
MQTKYENKKQGCMKHEGTWAQPRIRTKNHDVRNAMECGHKPRTWTNNHKTHSRITKSTTNA